MHSASEVRDLWGAPHFVTAPADGLSRFRLSDCDREVLATIGLPVAPASALRLALRFESVDVRHLPARLRLLSETSFQPSRFYPLTGDAAVDEWARLDRFVVLGEAPNDFGPGPYFLTRFVCLDSLSRRVCWVYPKPNRDGVSECAPINTSLPAYLASLLAYKQFRDQWPILEAAYHEAGESCDEPCFRDFADQILRTFVRELETADPAGFRSGFWECHAANEAILLESF